MHTIYYTFLYFINVYSRIFYNFYLKKNLFLNDGNHKIYN
jgi:hypothetical protein